MSSRAESYPPYLPYKGGVGSKSTLGREILGNLLGRDGGTQDVYKQ
ncbi:MAG: hypothetical protein RLZZ597_2090 [Cyanobacteriota bacterium]|jgi:hypothetical protein